MWNGRLSLRDDHFFELARSEYIGDELLGRILLVYDFLRWAARLAVYSLRIISLNYESLALCREEVLASASDQSGAKSRN